MERKHIYGIVGILLAVTVIIVAMVLLSTLPGKQTGVVEGNGGDAIIDGVSYKEKNLTTVLFIITDGDGNKSEAVKIMLLSLDALSKTYGELSIDTDVLTSIPVMTSGGSWTGESRQDRLAVAQSGGDSPSSGCLNTKRAVSNLLYGLKIDYYICVPVTSSLLQKLDLQNAKMAMNALYEAMLSAEANNTTLSVTATDMTSSTVRRIVADMEKYTGSHSFTLGGTAASGETEGLHIDIRELNDMVVTLYYERVQTNE